jgi:hypothetical protein
MKHHLVGYNAFNDKDEFSLLVPESFMDQVCKLVIIDNDDPVVAGCYVITRDEAVQIAKITGYRGLPNGLVYYLEATQ